MREHDDGVLRFSWAVRIQHMVLAASCLILIATGMPLKFPYVRLSQVYFSLTGGVHTSGVIHRVGAVGLICVGAFHMLWILLTRDGRRNLRALIPSIYDVKTVFVNVFWFLGLGKARARFGRFSYIEKFDYWAVYWGCVVMIGSGLMLWLDNTTMRYLPKLAMDVAREAHSDEGLLATLAILIWHFYNVHLNPDHFPMSKTWLTGRIAREEMVEHHPLEYEQMLAEASGAAASERSED
jgi:cytochrome b subunit of formate dehydrogenase